VGEIAKNQLYAGLESLNRQYMWNLFRRRTSFAGIRAVLVEAERWVVGSKAIGESCRQKLTL